MSIYFFLDLLFIFMWLIYPKIDSKFKCFVYNSLILILIFLASFRGGFTSDYDNYVKLFNIFKDYSFKEVILHGLYGYPELGYLLWQFIVNRLTNSTIALFTSCSVLIVLAHGGMIKKYSDDVILGLFLFLEVGNFYTSFNIMRQIMAASISLFGTRYLIDRKLRSYLFVVFLASSFHKTALVLIPVYFVVYSDISINSIIRYCVLILLIWISTELIVGVIHRYAYSDYTYGMGYLSGYGWKNMVVPFSVSCFGVHNVLSKKPAISNADATDIVFFNLSLLNMVFVVLGLRMMMFDRFSSFFSTYAIILASNGVAKNERSRRLFGFIVCILLVIYGYVAKDAYPYSFFWE